MTTSRNDAIEKAAQHLVDNCACVFFSADHYTVSRIALADLRDALSLPVGEREEDTKIRSLQAQVKLQQDQLANEMQHNCDMRNRVLDVADLLEAVGCQLCRKARELLLSNLPDLTAYEELRALRDEVGRLREATKPAPEDLAGNIILRAIDKKVSCYEVCYGGAFWRVKDRESSDHKVVEDSRTLEGLLAALSTPTSEERT